MYLKLILLNQSKATIYLTNEINQKLVNQIIKEEIFANRIKVKEHIIICSVLTICKEEIIY